MASLRTFNLKPTQGVNHNETVPVQGRPRVLDKCVASLSTTQKPRGKPKLVKKMPHSQLNRRVGKIRETGDLAEKSARTKKKASSEREKPRKKIKTNQSNYSDNYTEVPGEEFGDKIKYQVLCHGILERQMARVSAGQTVSTTLIAALVALMRKECSKVLGFLAYSEIFDWISLVWTRQNYEFRFTFMP